MPIFGQKNKERIRFIIWGELCQKITDWEIRQDEIVLNEQLSTGSFHGKFPVDNDLMEFLKYAKSQGKILPYYGAGGSRGACVYQITPTETGHRIRVEQTVTKAAAEFQEKEEDGKGKLPTYFKTWLAANLNIGHIEKPYFILTIDGRELIHLREWPQWHEKQAFMPRYTYEFGQVSLGRLGFTITVTDNKSGESINVTCYEDW